MKKKSLTHALKNASIDREITSILSSLESCLPESMAAVKVRPGKASSCCVGTIQIFMAEDLRRKAEDQKYVASPVEVYAFYPSIYSLSHIGSVAIYGDNTFPRYLRLKKNGYLFGRKIKKVEVEFGLSPFVDVTLMA